MDTIFFKAAFQSAATALILLSENGSVLAANNEAHHLLGYSRGELEGQRVSEIMDEKSARRIPTLAWEHPYGQFRLEGQGRRKLGSLIPLAFQGAAVVGDGATDAHATLLELNDMAGISEADETCHESESRFRLVFEQAAVGIVFQGPPGDNFLRVNGAFADLLRYSREELYTMSVKDLTHPDDVQKSHEVMSKVFRGEILGSASIDKRYYRRDGSSVWCRVTVSLAREPDGSPWFLMAVIEDISKQKHYENKLLQALEEEQHQKARLEAILASLPDGLLILDSGMRVEEVNNHLASICPSMEGLKPGHPLTGQEDHMPRDLLQVVDSLARQQKEVMGYRFICRVQGGEIKHLMVNASMVREKGRGGMVFLVRDISDIPALADFEIHEAEQRTPEREMLSAGGLDCDAEEERCRVLEALRRTDWNKAKASRLLGIGRTTLYRKLEALNIRT